MYDNYYDKEVQDAVIYLMRLLGSLSCLGSQERSPGGSDMKTKT